MNNLIALINKHCKLTKLNNAWEKLENFVNSRRAFSIKELIFLLKAGLYFYIFRIDPLYQGHFEKKFTDKFCDKYRKNKGPVEIKFPD